jgi:hypothetical protein
MSSPSKIAKILVQAVGSTGELLEVFFDSIFFRFETNKFSNEPFYVDKSSM